MSVKSLDFVKFKELLKSFVKVNWDDFENFDNDEKWLVSENPLEFEKKTEVVNLNESLKSFDFVNCTVLLNSVDWVKSFDLVNLYDDENNAVGWNPFESVNYNELENLFE